MMALVAEDHPAVRRWNFTDIGKAPNRVSDCRNAVTRMRRIGGLDQLQPLQPQIVRQPGEGLAAPLRDGAITARTLFDDGAERVAIEDWRANATVTVGNERGLEFILLSGRASVNGEELEAQSWGRLPVGQELRATTGPEGVLIWFKDAPLLHPDVRQLPE